MSERGEMIERVARALMEVRAQPPGSSCLGIELPVLALDPDFDDLPANGSEGAPDDEITQEAVLRLARAAIEAMREPTEAMIEASNREWDGRMSHRSSGAYQAMIDAALEGGRS